MERAFSGTRGEKKVTRGERERRKIKKVLNVRVMLDHSGQVIALVNNNYKRWWWRETAFIIFLGK